MVYLPEIPQKSERIKFRFEKLVRHKILDRMIEQGARVEYEILVEDEAMVWALRRKLKEESRELKLADVRKLVQEIADLQEVIDALGEVDSSLDTSTYQSLIDTKLDKVHVSKDRVKAVQEERREQDGDFYSGIYIETVEINRNDPWVQYFQDNADRYPEMNV